MRTSHSEILGRGLWIVPLWLGLGLAYWTLNLGNTGEPRSVLWFAELFLYGLMIGGLWANSRFDLRKKLHLPRKLAPVVYISLFWLFGMAYEASLTLTGEGIGGMHAQTLISYILAQGDYIPLALISYLVIWRTGASFWRMFFFAGGVALTEGIVFNGTLTSVLFSPMFFLAPLVLAYFTLAYGSFIALPLLFVDEELLWKKPRREQTLPILLFWLLGFALAIPVRLFWGFVYLPLAARLLGLPAN